MAGPYPESFRYIADFVKWLAPDAKIHQGMGFTCLIDLYDDRTDVRFDQAEMEDFEVALERFKNTNYFHTLENRIRFRIFIALGSKGLIPCLQISSELLQEKGEWLKNLRTDVAFGGEFCKVLYHGLMLLSASIGRHWRPV